MWLLLVSCTIDAIASSHSQCVSQPSQPLQEEQRELAKTICVSGAILLSTVSNFLDFFKLEAGKVRRPEAGGEVCLGTSRTTGTGAQQ